MSTFFLMLDVFDGNESTISIEASVIANSMHNTDDVFCSIYNLEPAGDPEAEKTKQLRAQVELARLQRNQERRIHRERLKLKKQDGERQKYASQSHARMLAQMQMQRRN